MYLMDNGSVCSDDTDLLLSTSCNFKDLQGSYLSRSPDRYSMTEKYINENTNDQVGIQGSLSERSQGYDYGSGKSRFTSSIELNKNVFAPSINNIEIPHTYTYTATKPVLNNSKPVLKNSPNKSLLTSSNEGIKITSHTNSVWRDEKISSLNDINSMPARLTSSLKSVNGLINYNGTPSKSVKFEDSLGSVDDTKHFQQTYLESTPQFGKNMYGIVVDEKVQDDEKMRESEFDMIDEKVKEGKAILQRLLNSTEAKKPSVPKTFSRKDHHRFAGKTTLDTACKTTLDTTCDEGVGTLKYDNNYSNDAQTESLINPKDLKDPIFMSTRLDMSDERSAIICQNEESLLKSVNNERENIPDEHLVAEIKELKEELAKYQMNSFHEIKSLREENEKVVTKLYGQLSSLNKQKETFEDYVNQLKGSLSKKNERCSVLQEQLHDKLTLIHKMSTTDNEEHVKLENEVNVLHDRKRTLEEQIEKMEKSFKVQYNEIKELEGRFQSEKQINSDELKKKDEEIALLHRRIELISEENSVKEVELKSEMETQVEKAVLRGKSLSQLQVNEMKYSLDNEVERHLRLESKHQVEVRHLKANFETFKAVNTRLKKELDVCLEQNRQLERNNLESMKKVRDEAELEADLLKKKIIGYEKVQRSMALELIEESTKLAVVCGTSPSTSRMSSQDAYVDCNVMSEAMIVFKEHLEAFRHHVLSLRHNKEQQKNETNDENSLPTINVQTSAKLLRHLQNRVQQLRKENAMLRENSICESCQSETRSYMVNGTLDKNSLAKQSIHAEDNTKSLKHLEVSFPHDNHENFTECQEGINGTTSNGDIVITEVN